MSVEVSNRRFIRNDAGLALVEFAIVLPLLMMVLIGLIEIGRLTYFTIEVANAAHAGAAYGALSSTNTPAQMQTAATQDGQNSISNLTATAQYVCSCWNASTGVESPAPPTHAACTAVCTTGEGVTYAQVSVQGTINALFNYGHVFGLPTSWSVTRVATIRVTP